MTLNKKIFIALAGFLALLLFIIAVSTKPVNLTGSGENFDKISRQDYQTADLSDQEITENYEREAKLLLDRSLELLAREIVSDAAAEEIKTAVLELRVPAQHRDFHLLFYQALSGLEDCTGPAADGDKLATGKNLADLRTAHEWLD